MFGVLAGVRVKVKVILAPQKPRQRHVRNPDHTLGRTVLHIQYRLSNDNQAMPAKLRMRLPGGRLKKPCGSKWRPLTPRDHRLSRKQIQEDIHQNKTTRDAVQVCVAARDELEPPPRKA